MIIFGGLKMEKKFKKGNKVRFKGSYLHYVE